MAEFKTLGISWSVTIDVLKVRRVRERRGGLDLAAQDGTQLRKLAGDVVLSSEVLWDLVESQAAAANISQEAFFSALGGDDGDRAAQSLFDAIIDFFPKARREALRRLRDTDAEMETAGLDLAVTKLSSEETTRALMGKLEADIDAALDAAINGTRFAKSTDLPASSASTPPA